MSFAGPQSTYNPPAHQREVDQMMAAIRAQAASPEKRPLFKAPPPRPQLSERTIDLRIAEELEVLRRRIEHIGDVLSNDPVLLHRHGVSLQGIDLTSQTLNHLANVIAAEDKEAAVEVVSLSDLKSRLRRKPLAP